MQLSTLVLPAPFGPIRANSSPGSTAKETPSSTTRPPKRSVSPSISISAIPSPAAPILLHLAITAPVARRVAEIELLDVAVREETRAVAVEHDPSILQHIAIVGDCERHGRALLDDHNGDAELVADLEEPRHQVFDHDRRQAQRQFVDQQKLRPTHQRACNREHLTLAARQEPGHTAAQIAQAREECNDRLLALPPPGAAHSCRDRCAQVLRHGEIGKYFLALRHERDAAARNLVWRAVFGPAPPPGYPPPPPPPL